MSRSDTLHTHSYLDSPMWMHRKRMCGFQNSCKRPVPFFIVVRVDKRLKSPGCDQ
jgi:hypothetical protein